MFIISSATASWRVCFFLKIIGFLLLCQFPEMLINPWHGFEQRRQRVPVIMRNGN